MNNKERFDSDIQGASHPDVIVIGDVLMDYQYWIERMPNSGEDVAILSQEKNSGGSAANTAIALSSEGISCGFCGRIGEDEAGREITELMKNIGLDLTYLQYGGTTGYTLTLIEESGERTMFSYRDTAGNGMTLTPRLRQALCNAKLLFLSGYMLTEPAQAEYAIETAKQIKSAGGIVMLDASPKIGSVNRNILDRVFALTDVLSPNKDELAALAETDDVKKGLDILAERVPCVILKQGANGSVLVVNPGFPFIGGDANSKRIEIHAPAKQIVSDRYDRRGRCVQRRLYRLLYKRRTARILGSVGECPGGQGHRRQRRGFRIYFKKKELMPDNEGPVNKIKEFSPQ